MIWEREREGRSYKREKKEGNSSRAAHVILKTQSCLATRREREIFSTGNRDSSLSFIFVFPTHDRMRKTLPWVHLPPPPPSSSSANEANFFPKQQDGERDQLQYLWDNKTANPLLVSFCSLLWVLVFFEFYPNGTSISSTLTIVTLYLFVNTHNTHVVVSWTSQSTTS